jgi:uncharacterized protein (DUF169 family)
MQSRIAEAIHLASHPVAITWADAAPEGAAQFKPGGWGCAVSLIASVAAKGRVVAFDRHTYGCWGAGVGLGFGNQYEAFPGGVDCFARFLSNGNERDPAGNAIGQRMAEGGGSRLADQYLKGERYIQQPEAARKFVESLPIRDIGERFVVAKPLAQLDAAEDIKSITFFVEPDALSALVVLAHYVRPEVENVAIPWAAACQVIGLFGYRESERERPRALVGLTDLSARKYVRPQLGPHVMSFTVPYSLFLEFEANVEGSFLERETWSHLIRKD